MPYYVTMAIQSEHTHFVTKWCTIHVTKLYNAVNKYFKSYVRRIAKLNATALLAIKWSRFIQKLG